MLDGGYVRGVKVETSLSSAVERRTAVDEAAGREMRLPFDVPNRDPRLRNMLYRLQQRTAATPQSAAVPQSAAAWVALRAGDNPVPATLQLQFCGDDAIISSPSSSAVLPQPSDCVRFAGGRGRHFEQRTPPHPSKPSSRTSTATASTAYA